MLLVGLTGGLGAGKSTVAKMLADRGAVVVDADDLARRALEPGTRAFKQVCDIFGEDVLASDGSLDRRALAEEVFGDEKKRRALESITHPEVFRMLAETLEDYRRTSAIVVFDAALIVEAGLREAFDVMVVVAAPPDQQVARVADGRGMSQEEARARIAAQARPEKREAAADVIIRNDVDFQTLEQRVDDLWTELRDRSQGKR